MTNKWPYFTAENEVMSDITVRRSTRYAFGKIKNGILWMTRSRPITPVTGRWKIPSLLSTTVFKGKEGTLLDWSSDIEKLIYTIEHVLIISGNTEGHTNKIRIEMCTGKCIHVIEWRSQYYTCIYNFCQKDWLFFSLLTPLGEFSLIWRRHYCRLKDAKFRPIYLFHFKQIKYTTWPYHIKWDTVLWAHRFRAVRGLHVVTRGLGFCCPIRRPYSIL